MIEAKKAKKEVPWATYNIIPAKYDESGTEIEPERQELISDKKEIEASFFTCPGCGLESWTSTPVGKTIKVQCGRCSSVNELRVVS